MPYSTIKELPPYLKKYSEVIRRQWMYVFNSVYQQTQSEARAFRAANSILKKRFTKKEQMAKQSHGDFFSYLIDDYLENI